jgi:hypothetical protein
MEFRKQRIALSKVAWQSHYQAHRSIDYQSTFIDFSFFDNTFMDFSFSFRYFGKIFMQVYSNFYIFYDAAIYSN